MDTFNEPLSDSETTGLPSLEPRDESSTGPRPGATGSAATPTDCDVGNVIIPQELLAALRAREAKRKAEVRSAIAEKTMVQGIRDAIDERRAEDADDPDGTGERGDRLHRGMVAAVGE